LALTPAQTPEQNQALLREVDDAVRQDDLRQFWFRYGRWLIGAIIVGLVAFGGYLIWQQKATEAAELNAQTFSEQLKLANENNADPVQLDALAKSGGPGYRGAAMLTKAALAITKGDMKQAVALYGSMASDATLPQPFRDLAVVRQTALQLDTLPPQDVINRLRPYASEKSPWFGTAGEMTAFAHMKLGQAEQAGVMFAALASNPAVPATIQTRAVQMASMLGVDAQTAAQVAQSRETPVNAE
jgi:hypothetical protein